MSYRFRFRRFDAVDHQVSNVHLQWSCEASRQSLAELGLLVFWKLSYLLDSFIPPVRRALTRSLANVYLGTALPQSQLRAQLARLRNESQYGMEGAGIDVGFAPPPGQPAAEWAMMHEWFKGQTRIRLHMQMYQKVTSLTELKDKTVLEVGCGQGDGAFFLAVIRAPARVFGLDRHPRQIELSRQRHAHRAATLRFHVGDAQALPFPDARFDVVVNIESSHSYPRFELFADEVFRVLKPGGTLCFADLRKAPRGTRAPVCSAASSSGQASRWRITRTSRRTPGGAWRSCERSRRAASGPSWKPSARFWGHAPSNTTTMS